MSLAAFSSFASKQVIWNVSEVAHMVLVNPTYHNNSYLTGLLFEKAEFPSSSKIFSCRKHYGFQVRNMSKCPRRNISCWQYWISWTTFVKIYYYTQHTSCQFKYSCDIMIGLTCSWAWSIGPTLLFLLLPSVSSPPWLPRGGGELSLTAFLFLFLFLSILSLSISLCLLSLMTNLSAAPVVPGCECSACDWMIHSVLHHESISACPLSALSEKPNLWSVTMSNPNWGIYL